MYSAQHVTGPTHNLLRLKLRRGEDLIFPVTVLPPLEGCNHGSHLTADDVIPAIRAGVARANALLETNFAVERAEICANDSRRFAVYELLARRIVEWASERSS